MEQKPSELEMHFDLSNDEINISFEKLANEIPKFHQKIMIQSQNTGQATQVQINYGNFMKNMEAKHTLVHRILRDL